MNDPGCDMNAHCGANGPQTALRILGIAAVAAVLLAFGMLGAKLFHTASAPACRPGPTRPEKARFVSVRDGADLTADFPVPPSGEMAYAVSQADRADELMVLYTSKRLSAGQVAEFYCEELPKEGWREADAVEKELNKHAQGIMLFFRRPGRECVMHVEPDGPGAKWVVILRRSIIGGGGEK